jgi:ADP-heptose:LPS heptosyltransferase
MESRWLAVRRLLVVRLDNLGDVILATPAIRALRRALPEARLTLLASPVGSQVAELNPDVDDAIVYRAPWMDPDRLLHQEPSRDWSVAAEIRRRGIDGAVIFTSYHQSSLPAAYLCYLADVPLRHAASVDGPGSLLTSRHRHPTTPLHEVERGLDLVRGIGAPPAGDGLVLHPTANDVNTARQLVRGVRVGRQPVVAISPGSSCPSRTYPSELFGMAADALHRILGAHILWLGSKGEIELVERIRDGLDDPGTSLVGRTSLSQIAATIAASDLAITNNSGPMHVAAAVGTPVVALFALTNPPEEWRPWGVPHRLLNHPVPCARCYQRVCPYGHECLRGVSAADVVRAAHELLEEAPLRERQAVVR